MRIAASAALALAIAALPLAAQARDTTNTGAQGGAAANAAAGSAAVNAAANTAAPINESELIIPDGSRTAAAANGAGRPASAPLAATPGVSTWDFVRMLLILAAVVGAIYLVFWLMRRSAGKKVTENDLIHVLGSRSLAGNRALHLVEVGRSIYLVGSSDGGVELIAEITDKESLDSVRLKAAEEGPAGRRTFQQILAEIFRPAKGLFPRRRAWIPPRPARQAEEAMRKAATLLLAVLLAAVPVGAFAQAAGAQAGASAAASPAVPSEGGGAERGEPSRALRRPQRPHGAEQPGSRPLRSAPPPAHGARPRAVDPDPDDLLPAHRHRLRLHQAGALPADGAAQPGDDGARALPDPVHHVAHVQPDLQELPEALRRRQDRPPGDVHERGEAAADLHVPADGQRRRVDPAVHEHARPSQARARWRTCPPTC